MAKAPRGKIIMKSVVLSLLAVVLLLSTAKIGVDASGDKYPPFDAAEIRDAINSGFAADGEVTFRKQYRVPRAGSVQFEFGNDKLAMIDFRTTGVEPTRFSDLIVDDNLQGIFINKTLRSLFIFSSLIFFFLKKGTSSQSADAWYQAQYKNKLIRPGDHSIEIRFWDWKRTWRNYDNWPYPDDDRDEPSFWVRVRLFTPTEKQVTAAIKLEQESAENAHTQTQSL